MKGGPMINIQKTHRAIRRSKMKLAQKSVLSALIDLVDWKTWTCDASLRAIKTETNLSKSTIATTLIYLEEKGFIKRRRQGDERGHTRSAYKVEIDMLTSYLEDFYPLSDNRTSLSDKKTTLVRKTDNPLSDKKTTLVQKTDNPLSDNRTPYQPSISTKNTNQENQPSKSPQESAQGASKEVRRYPKGHFCEGAIIVDGDDWEFEVDQENEKAWKEGGYTPPTREELRKEYK